MSDSSFELLDQSQPILIFGSNGQIGRALQLAFKEFKGKAVFLGRADCDFTSEASIAEAINHYQPQVIINAAAYTAVDKAETEPDLAFAINAKAPELMARYIANVNNGILVHYSTDYVFADIKKDGYLETDTVGPDKYLNVYGQSKLAGELAIEKVFKIANGSNNLSCAKKIAKYFILRTSWVYGDGDNFIRMMLRLGSECDQLKVVADQVGAPTSAQWLAEISMRIIDSRLKSGIYHAVPDGETSWYSLAVFVIEAALDYGPPFEIKFENILPISAADYLTPVRRPYNSRLNNTKLKMALLEISFTGKYPHWREQVKEYVKDFMSTMLKK